MTPGAERRLVSVLFADLVGFTPFAEGRDAEEVRETLSRYFDLASDVIARFGGTIEKFIGDAVMAVWGAPAAHEDDAERAVRAALELVDVVPRLDPGVQARAGVLTGEVAVTIGATNQGMVAGDLVNTAGRLQSVAAPGTVLVGEATHRAASRAIAFEEAGEQILKGKAAPLHAWRAVRVIAERGGRDRAEGLEAPFVGRDDELRLLKDLFDATTRERRARLVSVVGPGGIGKTRLARELLRHLDGLVEPVWSLEGRSPAYGDGVTFWALGEMVRGRAGLVETDDAPTTRTKVAAMLAEHVPDPAERRWIEPALLTLLGVEAGLGWDQLFGAWRTFLERLAGSRPVVMVFEDFHYADPGLLDFVDHLLEWSRKVPIFVVTLARPELLERRPDWGASTRSFASLFLEPLTEPAMRELLGGLVPGLPAPTAEAIVARADGVPLYAVETVRMLVADGRLRLEGGAYVPTGDLASLPVPETLTELVAARLDGLDPADRGLLQDAAVLGRSFTVAALSAVSGIAPADLERRLSSLVRRDLLALDADPRSPERGQYIFVQALVQEVAYSTLARADRTARHLAAARYFESRGSDEIAGAVAGQYVAACRNAPAGSEADAIAGRARAALSAAAARAAAVGAPDQAVTFLVQALQIATDPAEEAGLLERAAEAASDAAHHEQADDFLRRAMAIWRERGDRPATARCTAALGRALLSAWRTDVALAVLETAAEEFADLEGDAAGVALGCQLARAHYLQAEPARAVAWADRTLPAAERLDLADLVADLLVSRGSALALQGRTYEGMGDLRAGLDVAQAHGLSRTAVRARMNLAYGQSLLGGPVGSLAITREALADARRQGDRSSVAGLTGNAAWDARLTGEWDWAQGEIDALLATEPESPERLMFLSEALVLCVSRGEQIAAELAGYERLVDASASRAHRGLLHETRAEIALAQGRLAEARTESHGAVEHIGNPLDATHQLARAARAALWAGDVDGAREDLAALDALCVHGPMVSARRTVVEAGITAADGRTAEALALYRAALRRLRDLGCVWEEALVGIDMATLLDPADQEVRAAAESAREILVRLGARPYLERLETAMARTDASMPKASAEPSGEVRVEALRADR